MNKFCPNCGKQLQEGEVCNCTANQQNINHLNNVNTNHVAQGLKSAEKASWKKIDYIVQIVVGGILALLGLICFGYDWGFIALSASVGFLVTGILHLIHVNEE